MNQRYEVNKELEIIDNQKFPHTTDYEYPINELSSLREELSRYNCEYLYNYISSLKLRPEDILTLPSQNHFFYAEDELKNTKATVSLSPLNNISRLKKLLGFLSNKITSNNYFMGFYIDETINKDYSFSQKSLSTMLGQNKSNEKITDNGFVRMVDQLIQKNPGRKMKQEDIRTILRVSGFKLADITPGTMYTYFYARKLDK